MSAADAAWWGDFEPAIGAAIERDLGPLRLRIERDAREWRILEIRAGDADTAADAGAVADRYAVGATEGPLTLHPMVADRPVVAAPLAPLHVIPGGRVTLFVSTPLWYAVDVGVPPQRLQERFIERASDTWFGPSTQVGELCYASHTAGRLELDEVPMRPERAVTAVEIRNDTATVLPILKLNLPAPHLALYADAAGMLWTQDVVFDNRAEEGLADLDLGAGAPRHARAPQRLAPPRLVAGERRLFRAFGAMFR